MMSGSVVPSGADRLNTTVRPAVEATPVSGTDSARPSGPAASTRKARHAQTKVADLRAGAGGSREEQGGRPSGRQQRQRQRERLEQQRGQGIPAEARAGRSAGCRLSKRTHLLGMQSGSNLRGPLRKVRIFPSLRRRSRRRAAAGTPRVASARSVSRRSADRQRPLSRT